MNMSSETQQQSSLSLAENVALLSLLSRAPAERRDNPRPSWADDQGVLSFDREAELAATIAFLSGVSDSPSHVVATCVEERSGGGIRVAVAMNRERPGSGDDVLARIKSGLERIFCHLANYGLS
jgi:hypothetical protein